MLSKMKCSTFWTCKQNSLSWENLLQLQERQQWLYNRQLTMRGCSQAGETHGTTLTSLNNRGKRSLMLWQWQWLGLQCPKTADSTPVGDHLSLSQRAEFSKLKLEFLDVFFLAWTNKPNRTPHRDSSQCSCAHPAISVTRIQKNVTN